MWLSAQKVLRFIPGINLITLIFWIISGIKKKLGIHYFVKNVLIMLALVAIVLMIGRGIATFTSNAIFSDIVFSLSLVIYSYIGAFVSVNEQELIIKGSYDKNK